MLFFGDPSNKDLSQKTSTMLGADLYYPEVHIFPDFERRIRILENVLGQTCLVLKSLNPPVDSNIMEFSFTIDALKRSGADKVFGIVPYLGYGRGDHVFRPGESVSMEVVIRMIETAGLDKIMIIDPHSIKIPEMFKIPVVSKTAIPLFAKKIKELKLDKNQTVLVSPDEGGVRRIKMLSDDLGGMDYVVVEKDRDLETGKLKISGVKGEVKETCIILDDMIATGGTIVEAADVLSKKGVKEIFVFATHGVLPGNANNKLQNSKVTRVFVTDTIPLSSEQTFEKLEILSVAPIVVEEVKTWSL